MRKVIIATLITVVLVGTVLLVDHSIRVNRPVPAVKTEALRILPGEIELVDFATKNRVKFAKYMGKMVVINFWASWCEACMAEMPSIEKLYEKFKDQGLVVMAINVDDDPQKVVPPIINALHLTFPIFTDPSASLQPIFNVVAIPYSLVADRHQRILWADSGERDWASPAVITDFTNLLKKI